ncbi:MAG: N-acetylglutamate synthase-like GNAT family acetyltransferase [Dokdonia sp.]|jgi:N-acetylglutamate synthase-like GNAT family acetyltransferase
MIKIVPYQITYQNGINDLMTAIALEFADSIFSKPSKETPEIPNEYWVALNDNEIIGTAAVLHIKNDFAILKHMMLKKEYRGKGLGISKALLETAINWCKGHHIPKIYLGTMTQFKVAQSFYIKNGFKSISEDELPKNFLNNPLDTIFFVRHLDSL